jgi:hypothetical protein
MKYFIIQDGSQCEFEIYNHNDILCEVLRDRNQRDIVFSEDDLIEERNLVGTEGTFMRFGRRRKSPITVGDFYEYVVVDTEKVIIDIQ